MVVAFTEKDHSSTWDTIKRAVKANKPVKIIRPSLFFPGENEQAETTRKNPRSRKADRSERGHST